MQCFHRAIQDSTTYLQECVTRQGVDDKAHFDDALFFYTHFVVFFGARKQQHFWLQHVDHSDEKSSGLMLHDDEWRLRVSKSHNKVAAHFSPGTRPVSAAPLIGVAATYSVADLSPLLKAIIHLVSTAGVFGREHPSLYRCAPLPPTALGLISNSSAKKLKPPLLGKLMKRALQRYHLLRCVSIDMAAACHSHTRSETLKDFQTARAWVGDMLNTSAQVSPIGRQVAAQLAQRKVIENAIADVRYHQVQTERETYALSSSVYGRQGCAALLLSPIHQDLPLLAVQHVIQVCCHFRFRVVEVLAAQEIHEAERILQLNEAAPVSRESQLRTQVRQLTAMNTSLEGRVREKSQEVRQQWALLVHDMREE